MGILFGAEKRSLNPTFSEPPVPPFPGANIYGQAGIGAPETALVVPTVWACVNLLANAVSMLPLETFRRAGGVPSRAVDPPLIVAPCGDMTQSEWLHMVMVSLLLRGNTVGRIVGRDGMMRPTQIEIQNPDLVDVKVDRDTGAITYRVGQQVVATADIWHVRGLTLPGQKVGLSPISYAAATLGVDIGSRKFAREYFDGGGIPKAVLTSDQKLDQNQSQTIKDRVKAAWSAREVAVLGAGLKYQQIQVNPEESQFLATQQANVGQIARYFNVPAGMVGGTEGGSMTYSNVEQRSIDFLTYSVSFWLKRLEDALFPLLPQPQFVRFNTEALLRTDAETQAKVDVQLTAGRISTTSEIRAKRGLPPLTDEQIAEMNWVPQLTINPNGGAKALPAAPTPGAKPAAPEPELTTVTPLVPKLGVVHGG